MEGACGSLCRLLMQPPAGCAKVHTTGPSVPPYQASTSLEAGSIPSSSLFLCVSGEMDPYCACADFCVI